MYPGWGAICRPAGVEGRPGSAMRLRWRCHDCQVEGAEALGAEVLCWNCGKEPTRVGKFLFTPPTVRGRGWLDLSGTILGPEEQS